jgi:outer membrane protein assembly factor BamB
LPARERIIAVPHSCSVYFPRLLALLLFLLSPIRVYADSVWPQFRGADARGVVQSEDLPATWSATENIEWKTDVAGRGWSSPIVTGGRIFLTTVVNTGESEEPKKGLYFGGERLEPPKDVHQWRALCLDLETGRVLWDKLLHEAAPKSSIHIKNSFASETPVTDGEHFFAYFGNLGLYCLTLEGEVVWQKPFEPRATRYGWGTAASPVIHDGRIYLVNDNDDDSFLMALDKTTGDVVWQVARDEKSNWSTPFIWENSQRTELVTLGTEQVRSYDLDGNLLWSLRGMSSITIATPYAVDDVLYISSGYVLDNTRPIYAIRPGAEGDISLDGDATSNEWIVWSDPKAAPYNPTTLVYQDTLYVLHDRGLFAAYDAKTGEPHYDRQRLPDGRAFTASPWAYGDKVFCLNEDGVTFVINAGGTFEISHTNALAEDDMCMATPAIVGDRLLIRTAARLYSVRKH